MKLPWVSISLVVVFLLLIGVHVVDVKRVVTGVPHYGTVWSYVHSHVEKACEKHGGLMWVSQTDSLEGVGRCDDGTEIQYDGHTKDHSSGPPTQIEKVR